MIVNTPLDLLPMSWFFRDLFSSFVIVDERRICLCLPSSQSPLFSMQSRPTRHFTTGSFFHQVLHRSKARSIKFMTGCRRRFTRHSKVADDQTWANSIHRSRGTNEKYASIVFTVINDTFSEPILVTRKFDSSRAPCFRQTWNDEVVYSSTSI